MRFYVVTVFPELIEGFCRGALLGKAQASERIEVVAVDPREHTTDRHRSVDDTPYGGGSGMVMQAPPLVAAMERAETLAHERGIGRPRRVLMSPQGTPLTQKRASELASLPALTLVCGRYEGVDERARRRVDEEISIGDFVLMGGEVAALAVIEATARLLDGVLGNPESSVDESHSSALLEHPHYTRPAEVWGEPVPAVLTSGNHAEIARWRRRAALRRTLERRPDLLARAELDEGERAFLRDLGWEG